MQLAVVSRLRYPKRPEVAEDPLEDRLAVHFEEVARRYLDPDRIEAIAEDLRIVKRRRVHSAGLVAAAFVVSAFEGSSDTEGRILDGWQTYLALGGTRSGESSFRRMAHKMVPVLRHLLRRRLRELGGKSQHPELAGRLASFADVLVPDGCGFKLAAALSGMYPGTGTPAELKLHAVYSIRTGAVIDVHATAGSVHDSDGFHPEWERDALYIWDLGYNSYPRFIDAVKAGAHVLQRLKDGANPIILASYGPEAYRRPLRDLEGKPLGLADACQFGYVHRQRVLDLDVEICDGKRNVVARVVCVPVDGQDRYYLTTLPREVFSAHDVAELYRLRWEVELFFRNWKGGVRLDQVRRLSNPASLELAITASMLAALLARDVSTRLNEMAKELDASTHEAFPP
jgi:hypothetical protein